MTELTSNQANCVFLTFPNPRDTGGHLPYESLGVGYLMSVLRQEGHQCTMIPVLLGAEAEAIAQLRQLNPDFIGMSLLTAGLSRAKEVGQALRDQLGTRVHICVGGYVATFAGDWLLNHPDWYFLDSIVRGEGENAITPLITAILNQAPVDTVEGVATHDHPKSAKSLALPVTDLDSLPWPARDFLDRNYASMVTTRGCTGRCTFCSGPHARNIIGGKVWRGRTPENVVDELESLTSRFGVDTFRIQDLTFEDPGEIGKQRVRRIAQLIVERGLSIFYQVYSQAYSWNEQDADLIRLLHRSGLERAFLGIESGSDRVLRLFKKRASLENNKRTLRLFRQANIPLTIGFMMFHPYFEWQDLEDNAAFLVSENFGYDWIYFSSQLHVYPGTEISEQLAQDGLLEPGYYESLDPFAYRYQNPGVSRLAHTLGQLFSETYLSERTKIGEFHERETRLSVYLSRLMRSFGDRATVVQAVAQAQSQLEAEKKALTTFNQATFAELLCCAKEEREMPTAIAAPLEAQYAEASRQVKRIHSKLALQLARQGQVYQVGKTWQLD